VRAERLINHFTGFSLSIRSIGHGLFDAENLLAARALAEAVTGAIHFVLWPKPTRTSQFGLFHIQSFVFAGIAAYCNASRNPFPAT
jgi:hypothetical protein